MNNFFRGKIEACLELSGGDANKFRRDVIKVTSLTKQGFHELNMTDVAYNKLQLGEDVPAIIESVL